MEIINSENKIETETDNNNIITKKKKLDVGNIKSIINDLIIHKVLDGQDTITKSFGVNNPIAKLCITYFLFNAPFCYNMTKSIIFGMINNSLVLGRYFNSLVFKQCVPVKKTFEINYIGDNIINQLYLAMDWYLKTHAKKSIENHIVVQMNKAVLASKEESVFEIQKSIPRDSENTFVYDNSTFYYSTVEFEDMMYGVSGKIEKKNYKLLLWSYDCDNNIIDTMSANILNMYAKSKLDNIWKQKIFNHKNGTWEETSIDKQKRRINSVILNNNMQYVLDSELKYFIDNEKWFNDKNIPYKKSYLFYGPPGTGKTSMIRAIGHELQRHIYYLNLANIKNDEELSKLMRKLSFIDIILIIEDIDAQTNVVKNRTDKDDKSKDSNDNNKNKNTNDNNSNGNGISLSGLLNQIDGVNNNHGMILIMTTNRPEYLDKALIREGRVDEKIFFGYATNNQIFELFKNFYDDDNIVTIEKIEKMNFDETLTPAIVENAMVKNHRSCIKAFESLKKYDGNNNNLEKFIL